MCFKTVEITHIPPTLSPDQITCCVVVTTPHTLALIDVEKGVEMFRKLQVDTVAIVLNMAFFVCDNCDKRHLIFGKIREPRLGGDASP